MSPPLTVAEAAQALGLSERSIHRLLTRGLLERTGVGSCRALRISPESVERVRANTQRAHTDSESETALGTPISRADHRAVSRLARATRAKRRSHSVDSAAMLEAWDGL